MTEKQIILRLMRLFRPHLKPIIAVFVCLLASTGANLLIPLASKQIMDAGFLQNDLMAIAGYASLALGLVAADRLFGIFKEKIRAEISLQITCGLYDQAYDHLSRLKLHHFSRTNDGQLFNHISTDVGNMAAVADSGVFFVFAQMFSMIGGMSGLFLIDWRLALAVIAFIPVRFITVKFFSQRRKRLVHTYIESSGEFAGWFADTFGGIRELRLFGMVNDKRKEFETKLHTVVQNQKKAALLEAWNAAFESVLLQLLITFLYIIGANLVFELQLTVGSIFAFITYSAYVTAPISSILMVGYMLAGILPSAKRFYEFLEWDEEETDSVTTEEMSNPPVQERQIIKERLEFDHVSFAYTSGQPVLTDISFAINAREKVALIGENGSGKTTLIELILRFHTPDAGTIRVDGTDIRAWELEKYRAQFSVVSQQVYLFDAKLLDNIAFGSTADEEDIQKAVEASQLSEFAATHAEPIKVGPNGSMLSGGQRQKIAMARALVSDKSVFIWDEATSNLDVSSELNINRLLDTRLKDKTVILVTHKADILEKMDKIILLHQGKVNQVGCHQDLLENNGIYKNMFMAYKEKRSVSQI